ncbi:AMP-dependent synthetase/ligase [Mycolicibacterium hippocampi]|uniref:Acyl-CoA synthetase n=1 Tax=Mycolicibacterium hippocampi TaxID=659824 RepID=A0A850Q025_9MYCO|nr:AMP-dependent synthetase/ligase [Mycolicibacterium hippocampi]NVN53464.1 Long-chain-fatty-acid--CoA ligase [Mycolicibacterium hippocampi]
MAEPPGLGAPTMAQSFLRTIAACGDAVALRTPDDTVTIRYRELPGRMTEVAAALAALGISPGDSVGMMLTNRPEFHVIDGAAMLMGAVPFSVYNTSPPEQLAYVLGDAGARVVFTERQFAPALAAVAAYDLELPHLIVVDDDASWSTFLRAGEPFDLAATAAAVQPGDLLTLIYTSGTTGPPKGVELTHANMVALLCGLHEAWGMRSGGQIISYLPQAHIADRWFSHYSGLMTYGGTITDVGVMADAIPTATVVRPTFWGGVPRVWEKLKSALQSGAFGPLDDPARVRSALGFDRCELFVIGAAPTTRDVLDFFGDLGIEICEAWGMSETSAIGALNRPGTVRLGSVGRPLPGMEIKLAEDDELLCRGPNVMAGYRNNPQKTAEAMDSEGWLHTGDVARIDEDGYVWIIDRKKELIINSAGKNMSPVNIESKLKAAGPLIGQACVFGDARPYIVALLVLDPEAGADPTDPAVVAAVQREVDLANTHLSRVEQVKRFTVLPEEWLPGGDELTPTMKLKRRPIADRYSVLIDALYS